MSISLTAPVDQPWETKAQTEFNEARKSHNVAMNNASNAEKQQYEQMLRSLQLYAIMKAACDSDQKTALGLLVGGKAVEQWEDNKSMTAAILQGLADAMGTTKEALCDELKTVTIPANFQSARIDIANA